MFRSRLLCPFILGLATGATLLASDPRDATHLGRVWSVNEDGWIGTWTRRGDSHTFDAHWRHPDGREVRDVLVLEKREGDVVVIYREGMKGRYTGRVEAGGRRIIQGTATWFNANQRWSAEIRGMEDKDLGPEALGRVWRVNEDGWIGVWTRMSDSATFEAHWRHPDGREVRDRIHLERREGALVWLYREGVKGRYTGRLDAEGRRILEGTATWFDARQRWTAELEGVGLATLGPRALGRVWTVNEDGWIGTWTRRGDSVTFDAHWRHPDGREVRDVLQLERCVGLRIAIYREGLRGRYTGELDPSGRRVLSGTATWFGPSQVWTAEIK